MTPTQVGIKLNDTTSASELDSFFTQVWSQDRRVKIVLDATDCRKISVGRILSMKGVLDEHRYSSRKYIDHTVVLVNSGFARFILRMQVWRSLRLKDQFTLVPPLHIVGGSLRVMPRDEVLLTMVTVSNETTLGSINEHVVTQILIVHPSPLYELRSSCFMSM